MAGVKKKEGEKFVPLTTRHHPSLIKKLNRKVKAGNRSKFVGEAIKEKLT